LTWTGIGLAAAALLGLLYVRLVKAGFLRYNRWDRRVRGSLREGDAAPDAVLTRYEDGSPLRLASLWESRPVVLVFGSCT
jgi:hypothetical protein